MQSGKKFSYKSNATIKFIDSRLKEKYILDDFKKVIDIKCTKWLNTSMEDYIRPQTLFSNKFEGYINESLVSVNNNKKDTVDKANETINKAKQFDWVGALLGLSWALLGLSWALSGLPSFLGYLGFQVS